ncbi:MAG TPA: glycosyltransferase [Fontimonas sp.]
MHTFKHYLITRFNLSEAAWPQDRGRPPPVLSDEWMSNRIELFREYCLASVVAQTQKNFQWLIYMDISTADVFRERIEALTAEHGFIRIEYINGMPSFLPAIRAHIQADAQGCTHVITSRVDNDDLLHCDFMGAVQAQFSGQAFQAVDFTAGYALQIKPQVRIGKNEHLSNPFISLIEANDQPRVVFSKAHAHWIKTNDRSRYRIVDDPRRLWMMVIHAENKANHFTGYGEVDWNVVGPQFMPSATLRQWFAERLVPVSQWPWQNLRSWWHVKSATAAKLLKRKLGRYRYRADA